MTLAPTTGVARGVITMQTDPRTERPTDGVAPEAEHPWGEPTLLPKEAAQRADAVKRIEKKRGWMSGFVAYIVVNAFLVGIWAMTDRGYFWPAWVLGGWGLGVVLSFWDVYVRKPISEDEIQQELGRR